MAVMAALADVGCPVPVVGLVPAAENAIGGNALRPGDVIRHYGGRTSEVTNTDAEGRLVLADAMAWAVAHLDPAVLVDVATLTGAIKVALGQQVGGVFANDDTLADALLECGAQHGRAAVAVPAGRGLRGASCRRGSPTPTTPAAGRGRSSPRCSSSTSPATCRGRTSTSPRPATPPRTTTSTPRARPASAPGCCSTGSARRTRSPASATGRAGVNGLTVRWSLADAPAGVEDALASYVAETSHARFSVMEGLRFKTWRCVPGEWFEGCYVFADDAARAAFQETFTAGAAESPGSQIIGSPPVLIEPCSIVAVAEGASGFVAAPRVE